MEGTLRVRVLRNSVGPYAAERPLLPSARQSDMVAVYFFSSLLAFRDGPK